MRLTKWCEAVAKYNIRLQKTVEDYGHQLDDIEEYSRHENLIILELPEKSSSERVSDCLSLADDTPVLQVSHKSVDGTVLEFFNTTLGVAFQRQYISIAHRLKAGPKDRVKPVILRVRNQ